MISKLVKSKSPFVQLIAIMQPKVERLSVVVALNDRAGWMILGFPEPAKGSEKEAI